jgi:hypothetical protein
MKDIEKQQVTDFHDVHTSFYDLFRIDNGMIAEH